MAITLEYPLTLKCVSCSAEYDALEIRYRCECGDILDVVHDLEALAVLDLRRLWDERRGARACPENSGVWTG